MPFDASAPSSPRGPVVLQVLPRLVSGGAERGTVDMAAALTQAGVGALVASAGGPMTAELKRARATHIELPLDTKNPIGIRRNVRRLERVIREHGVSLVHARSRAPAWSAWYACRRTGVPFVTTVHAPYGLGSAWKKRYNAVMMRGQRVIAVSDFVARHILETYPINPARLCVIPRGVDTAVFAPERVSTWRLAKLAEAWRLSEDRRIVLMPARFTRLKGHAVLLEALARLNRPEICCVMVGADDDRDDYREELTDAIARLGLTGVVRLAGRCDDMPAAYKLADVVVSASIAPEGFGRVLAEAQAMGRPVIATDIGGPREVVRHGETGWLVPPGDPAALAGALVTALDLDRDTRDWMAATARDHILDNFTVEAMTDATIAVYNEVLSRRPLPAVDGVEGLGREDGEPADLPDDLDGFGPEPDGGYGPAGAADEAAEPGFRPRRVAVG